jgi:hypothetical protein
MLWADDFRNWLIDRRTEALRELYIARKQSNENMIQTWSYRENAYQCALIEYLRTRFTCRFTDEIGGILKCSDGVSYFQKHDSKTLYCRFCGGRNVELVYCVACDTLVALPQPIVDDRCPHCGFHLLWTLNDPEDAVIMDLEEVEYFSGFIRTCIKDGYYAEALRNHDHIMRYAPDTNLSVTRIDLLGKMIEEENGRNYRSWLSMHSNNEKRQYFYVRTEEEIQSAAKAMIQGIAFGWILEEYEKIRESTRLVRIGDSPFSLCESCNETDLYSSDDLCCSGCGRTIEN